MSVYVELDRLERELCEEICLLREEFKKGSLRGEDCREEMRVIRNMEEVLGRRIALKLKDKPW